MEKRLLSKTADINDILDSPDILQTYAHDESLTHPVCPEAIVKPKTAEQVQKIVKWANETLTPLIPISSGPPHFRGDTVPGAGGAVIIDLSNMKRIIRLDSKNRVVMVEPGVTFQELIPELEKAKLRLNLPFLPRLTKSVIGSVLEREPVLMPKYHWDIADPLVCTEVIFGNGDLFRTGSAAGPGTLEEQWAVGGAQEIAPGPSQADWYRLIQGAQGTMGIVTWATIRCERLPRLEKAFLAGSSSLNNLSELVHWLVRLRLVNECLILNRTNLATILTKKFPQDFQILYNTLPPWVLFFCIAGYEYLPEERVAYQTREMLKRARQAGVEPVEQQKNISANELLDILKLPSEEPYWKLRPKGSSCDLFFLTTLDKVPEYIGIVSKLTERYQYHSSNIGVYLQPIVQGTCCHCEFNLFFDRKDEADLARMRRFTEEAVPALMANGAFFSRPYGPWADLAYRRDAETTAALRKIKGIFDPNNVMNPGKLCF